MDSSLLGTVSPTDAAAMTGGRKRKGSRKSSRKGSRKGGKKTKRSTRKRCGGKKRKTHNKRH